jgi:colanic acid biosynthesis glycosyl transferase WcaI
MLAVRINFGPEHTGIAPYSTQLCEHLAARGDDVRAFTGVPHYPSWTVDARDRFRIRRIERGSGLEVRGCATTCPSGSRRPAGRCTS